MKSVYINNKMFDGDATLLSFIGLVSPVKDCRHLEKVHELCESTYLLMLSMLLPVVFFFFQAWLQNILQLYFWLFLMIKY